jgi:hypothetical protein
VVPSRPVTPIVNRPVPELKAGWPSASAANELDRVNLAMMFAVDATCSYVGWNNRQARLRCSGRQYRPAGGRPWHFFGGLPTGTLSAAIRWSATSTARLAWMLSAVTLVDGASPPGLL